MVVARKWVSVPDGPRTLTTRHDVTAGVRHHLPRPEHLNIFKLSRTGFAFEVGLNYIEVQYILL